VFPMSLLSYFVPAPYIVAARIGLAALAVASVGGVYYMWRASIIEEANKDRDIRDSKAVIDTIKRVQDADKKLDDRLGTESVDCVLFQNGWLVGPVPAPCTTPSP